METPSNADELEGLRQRYDELSRFTYTVVHDLRAPLVTIKGFLALVERDLAADKPERVRQDLDHITLAADRLHRLVEDLLVLLKLGAVALERGPVSLDVLLHELASLMQGRLASAHVRLELPTEPLRVYGDRSRLLALFQNLLDNAIKFMGTQAEPMIRISLRAEAGTVLCEVVDNGLGVAPAQQAEIFKPFARGHAGIEGSGLGLAIAQRIVELHEGEIGVSSSGVPGEGSCFWVRLPQCPD